MSKIACCKLSRENCGQLLLSSFNGLCEQLSFRKVVERLNLNIHIISKSSYLTCGVHSSWPKDTLLDCGNSGIEHAISTAARIAAITGPRKGRKSGTTAACPHTNVCASLVSNHHGRVVVGARGVIAACTDKFSSSGIDHTLVNIDWSYQTAQSTIRSSARDPS